MSRDNKTIEHLQMLQFCKGIYLQEDAKKQAAEKTARASNLLNKLVDNKKAAEAPADPTAEERTRAGAQKLLDNLRSNHPLSSGN